MPDVRRGNVHVGHFVLRPTTAPRNLPPILGRLNREVNAIAGQAEMRERLLALGMEPAIGSPEEYTARQASDIAKWKKVVAESGAKID
ncbi:MAG: hypothetical protein ABI831_10175 [Betaproteobacteria bacterium]